MRHIRICQVVLECGAIEKSGQREDPVQKLLEGRIPFSDTEHLVNSCGGFL